MCGETTIWNEIEQELGWLIDLIGLPYVFWSLIHEIMFDEGLILETR